jgi:hypothetical protein
MNLTSGKIRWGRVVKMVVRAAKRFPKRRRENVY